MVVGLTSGYGAVGLHWLAKGANYLFLEVIRGALAGLGRYDVVLLPAAGGLLVGPLVYFVAREARGHGVPEIMLAVRHQGGRIRSRVGVVKGVAAALCVGSGGSAGLHGPAVQIGSGLGSVLAQGLRLPPERTRLLVACGAAGGIAATFNAPIGGVLFALEVILRNFTTRSFGFVVIASVSAVVVRHMYLGDAPAFRVPPYSLVSVWEFPLYLVLGALASLVARAFIWVLYRIGDVFEAWRVREYLKPAAGGLLVGVLGVWFPQVFGVGYDFTGRALLGEVGVSLMVVLLVFKLLGTSLTLGSGGSGGIFAPSLFLGAMLGGAFGQVVNAAWPEVTAAGGAYALVGMAALFAGAAHAPMTAIIILFEMTGDYRIIGPLMVASVVSSLLSEFLSRDSIYTLKLARRGVDVLGAEPDLLDTIPVSEAMTEEFQAVRGDLAVVELMERFAAADAPSLPVVDREDALIGIVSRSDAEEAVLRGQGESVVSEIMTPSPVMCAVEESLTLALQRLSVRDVAALPVLDPSRNDRLVGMLRRRDIIAAYQRAREQRPEFAARVDRLRETLTGARVFETIVARDSLASNQEVRSLSLPQDALLIGVRRGNRTLIPHGDTVLQPGDRVIAIAEREQTAELRRIFTRRASDE
ncbi:MAG: chloride channel protein [Armatimonadota bacterium]|nr:MAG: chloride channel protein [Armatimonadota bacterium]